MAGPVVTFDPTAWKAMFPEFSSVSDPTATGYFMRATLYFANNTSNPAFCDGNMATLLFLLTAHIATLSTPQDPTEATPPAGPQLVGRLTSASQGSVSVSSQLDSSGIPSEAFFTQTTYGFQFWQATAQYRTPRYVARSSFVPTAIRPFGFRRW